MSLSHTHTLILLNLVSTSLSWLRVLWSSFSNCAIRKAWVGWPSDAGSSTASISSLLLSDWKVTSDEGDVDPRVLGGLGIFSGGASSVSDAILNIWLSSDNSCEPEITMSVTRMVYGFNYDDNLLKIVVFVVDTWGCGMGVEVLLWLIWSIRGSPSNTPPRRSLAGRKCESSDPPRLRVDFYKRKKKTMNWKYSLNSGTSCAWMHVCRWWVSMVIAYLLLITMRRGIVVITWIRMSIINKLLLLL